MTWYGESHQMGGQSRGEKSDCPWGPGASRGCLGDRQAHGGPRLFRRNAREGIGGRHSPLGKGGVAARLRYVLIPHDDKVWLGCELLHSEASEE
jgi:hypothetical protein